MPAASSRATLHNLRTGCSEGQQPAATHLPGLPRPTAGRSVLPNSAGRAVQCARCPQPAVHQRSWQTCADGEDVREQRVLRAAQRRLQLEGRPERDPVWPGHTAVAAGFATCTSSSAAGSGAATDRGRRIRPSDRHVRWTGRTRVHTVQPGPQRRRGANMADDDAAPDGELTESSAAEGSPRATEVERATSEHRRHR